MKKQFFALSFLFFIVQWSNAQCPTGAITLSTQAQVDAFPTTYTSCTVIPDGVDLKIMGANITDLSPLSQLTSVLGAFEIRNCPLLANLNGLHNISVIGNDELDGFILRDLPALTSLAALANLDSITGEFTIRTCNALNSLTGLNGIVAVNGSVIIRDNAILQNLNGLNSLQFIGETLEIVQNTQLNDVSALANVDTIVGGIEGGIFIEANTILNNLYGLGNDSTSVGSNLDILLNPNLAICAVPVICNYLTNPPAGAVITINGNASGCNTEPEIIANCILLSTNDHASSFNDIDVFPNPFSDYFQIKATNLSELKVEIYNVLGSKINGLVMKDTEQFNTSGLAPGTYFIKVTATEGQFKVIKIMKK